MCLDYVFMGVMMMKEKFVEENVLEKTKGNTLDVRHENEE
jgi:hypothetical protein